MNKYKISFVGLGKLGLPLATNFAKVGNKVIAIDKSKDLIKTLNKGKAPWMERGLENNIKLAQDTIEYTLDYAKAVGTDISVILVNTPSVKNYQETQRVVAVDELHTTYLIGTELTGDSPKRFNYDFRTWR